MQPQKGMVNILERMVLILGRKINIFEQMVNIMGRMVNIFELPVLAVDPSFDVLAELFGIVLDEDSQRHRPPRLQLLFDEVAHSGEHFCHPAWSPAFRGDIPVFLELVLCL